MEKQQEPWEELPSVWKTKPAFFAWLRGNLRRAVWEKYPGKIIYKKGALSPPPEGYTGKAKSGGLCALTGEWAGNSKLQVDHIVGEASLKGWDDVESFIRHLCCPMSNMQLVEKEAHKIKSYAERSGIPFEEAMFEKKYIIPFKKLKADEQTALLQDSLEPVAKTAAKRVEQYRAFLQTKKD